MAQMANSSGETPTNHLLSGPRLIVDVPHLPSILGAEVFEPDVSERLTVGVAMGLGVSVTGGATTMRHKLGKEFYERKVERQEEYGRVTCSQNGQILGSQVINVGIHFF